MQLRWTEEAANDLERIADYLLTHAPDRASDLVRAVYDAPYALLTFPNRGRPGKKEGTREPFSPVFGRFWSHAVPHSRRAKGGGLL